MLVTVKTNFLGQAELEVQIPTLKKVLMEVSEKNRIPLLDTETGEVHSDFKIYLNGIDHERLPENRNRVKERGSCRGQLYHAGRRLIR